MAYGVLGRNYAKDPSSCPISIRFISILCDVFRRQIFMRALGHMSTLPNIRCQGEIRQGHVNFSQLAQFTKVHKKVLRRDLISGKSEERD